MLSACKIAKLRINGLEGYFDYSSELSSSALAFITSDFIQQTKYFMNHALKDAHIQKSGVDVVVSLGGSTNLVSIREMLCEIFGVDKINRVISPDTTVSIGAAAYAYAASSIL